LEDNYVSEVSESGTGQGLGPAIVAFIAYNCTTTWGLVIL